MIVAALTEMFGLQHPIILGPMGSVSGGGHSGARATPPLMPAVVEAVAPIPVVAAGGIAGGRGLAAALMLGDDRTRAGMAVHR